MTGCFRPRSLAPRLYSLVDDLFEVTSLIPSICLLIYLASSALKTLFGFIMVDSKLSIGLMLFQKTIVILDTER